ncbi:MAG: Right handed beta helix region [Candidatus Argoarchaeum ethanivorans]|uniref:Right handed beta helix region n=1 Tax=Candidatus Argoarchaeum ethanivorans TaxID=2608793 RepID=A0A811TBS3_9EURY|nr:MAG: Right handed beta helix region [Candidatus Argoarchaeum ethanivorans]
MQDIEKGILQKNDVHSFLGVALAIICFILLLAGINVAGATDYYVSISGDNTYQGNITHPWQNVSYATQQATAGDTIHLFNGTWYDEHVVFANSGNATHPITMDMHNGTPTLDGADKLGIGIYINGKDHILIDGIKIANYMNSLDIISPYATSITIRNCEFSDAGMNGMLARTSNLTLYNCTVHDTGDHGLLIIDHSIAENPRCFNNNISHCTVYNAPHNLIDIHTSVMNTTIEYNELYFTDDYSGSKQVGIYLHNHHTHNTIVRNNNLHDQPRPLEILNCNNTLVENNTFTNITNRAIMFYADMPPYIVDTATIRNNTVQDCAEGFRFFSNNVNFYDIFFDSNIISNTTYYEYYFESGTLDNITIRDNLPIGNVLSLGAGWNETGDNQVFVEYTDGRVFKKEYGIGIPYWYHDKSEVQMEFILGEQGAGMYSRIDITTYNMTAVPVSDYITIIVDKFNTSFPQGQILVDFTVNTTDGNNVDFTIWGLKPNYYYLIKRDDTNFTTEHANSSGYIQFNNSEWSARRFTIEEDNIPPTTTAIITPTPNEAGWNNALAVVTFSRGDNGGSGVNYTNLSSSQEIAVKIDGVDITIPKKGEGNLTIPLNASYGDSFNVTISNEGITEIWDYSIDNNSNVELTKNVTVKIDFTPSVTYSNVTVPDIASYSATILWTTDELADSLVKYDTLSGSYTKNASDTSYVTSHNVTLTGLTPNTTYYFVVNSTDQAGNSNQSIEYNFTTLLFGTISGSVTHTCNETGIAGVAVNLTQNGTSINSTVTDSSGSYTFTDIPLDTYNVTASKIRFWSNSTSVTVNSGACIITNLTLWLKGDLNNNGISADGGDGGDVTAMWSAWRGEITPDYRFDLNNNDELADGGDVTAILSAWRGEIILE